MSRRAVLSAIAAVALAVALGGFAVIVIFNAKLSDVRDDAARRQAHLAREQSHKLARQNRRQIKSNRRILFRECKRDNKLRGALTVTTKQQIEQTRSTPNIFGIPDSQFRKLIAQSIDSQRQALGRIAPSSCAVRIPPVGQPPNP